MKAIILARVSGEDQLDGSSIPAQTQRGREYADKKHLEVFQEFQFDESSLKDYRTKFMQIIETIKKSKEKVALVVETIDRLQRSFKESTMLDEFVKTDKLEIHFIRENLVIHKNSNSSEIQRWDFGVLFAKSYVLQSSDNIKRSINQKLKDGSYIGKAPLGYRNIRDEKGKALAIIDKETAPMVKKIFEIYSAGDYSLDSIILEAKKMGLKTKEGYFLRKSHLEKLLKNPFYVGYNLVKGQKYPHIFEKLISEKLFYLCQNVKERRKNRDQRKDKLDFVFKNVLHCENCGCKITAETHKNGRFTYYHCTNGKGNCKRVLVREEKLSKSLEKFFTKKLAITDHIVLLIQNMFDQETRLETEILDRKLASLKLEKEKLDNRLSAIYMDKIDGVITEEKFEELSRNF